MLYTKSVVFLVLSLFSGFALAQNYNWITPNKTYLKMYIAEDGIYRINKSDFVNSGINPSIIDPRTVKVFNKGAQILIYFPGDQDGVFNDSDYFDFNGIRNYGGITNTYDQFNNIFYKTNEFYNQYSDTSIYWIGWDGANGTRMPLFNYTTTTSYTPDYFIDTLHFEKDRIYSQGENLGPGDTRFLNNEKFKGEGWYWTLLANLQSIIDTFSTPNLFNVPQTASIKLFAYPQNENTSIGNEHSIEVYINGTMITRLFSNDFNRFDTTLSFSSSLLSATLVNNVTITYKSDPGIAGQLYFDFFEIHYPSQFKLNNKKLTFSTGAPDSTSKQFKVTSYNSSFVTNIYDVKNNFKIVNYTHNSDTLKFTAKGNARIEIDNDSLRKKPFRIKQRQVPDLVSVSNGADYLVIYNAMFQSQAEQLRSYRASHDNFRAVKAEIEDIYDIFNYGFESPDGVRNFDKYIYENWQAPQVKYICLMGRGSLDPKKNSSNSVYYQNLVPVYGNPTTDGYFGNVNIGTFYYYQQIAVGRFPAYYVTEAQTMVDKIIAYENQTTPEPWWKTFTFITGGSTIPEQNSYQQTSNFESNVYVVQKPISGQTVKIYRTDSSGSETFNYADSIKNEINRGTLFVNFRGHAGSQDWEVGMNDPNVLSNGNKLPLILSLTCFTGENAKSEFRGFGEKFIYLPNKGAMGFIGTTGWSFSSSGDALGTYIIQSLKLDSNRRIGELLKVPGKSTINDSTSFQVRNTVNSYNLIGDPAAKLRLPKIPEFVITNTDYKLSSDPVFLNDANILTIYPKNFGLYADSCKIRFQLKKNNQNSSYHDTVYKAFRFLDSVKYQFRIDTVGIYTMKVTLDQDNWYPLEDKTNNTAVFNLPLNQNSFAPLSPVDNSVIFKDSVEFTAINPTINVAQNSIRVILQLDTSMLFNSPVVKTFTNNSIAGVDTKFKTNIPVLVNNILYYWRTSSIINNDTTGWSKIQRFVYNNGITKVNKDRYINSIIPAVLFKSNPNQYSEPDFNNTNFYSDGIKLSEYTSNLYVKSLGSNREEASYFSVGNRNIYIDAMLNTGLNMVKVRKLNGIILDFKNLFMNSAASSDSLVGFLNTFDSTTYLMLLNAAYSSGGTTLTQNAKDKLRQFGSIYCDSIGLLGYFHTWSFIGYLGANHSQVSEMFDPCCRTTPGCTACDHWTASISSMNVTFKRITGTVSNIIGPASSWGAFSWNQSTVPNGTMLFDVIGIDVLGHPTTLLTNVQTNNFTDISSINAFQYPKLNLLAKFSLDSMVGITSPALNSIHVDYSPAAELAIDKNSLQINTNLKNSNVLNYSFNYHNTGFKYLQGIIVNVYNGLVSDSGLISTDTTTALLKIDSTLNYSHNLTAPRYVDSTRIYIYIKPKEAVNEFYTYNNTADFKIASKPSLSASVLNVTIDGKKINNNDYVSKKPEVKLNLSKTILQSLVEDTTQVSISLNNVYIPYYVKGILNPVLKAEDIDVMKSSATTLLYYPELNNGKNKLSIVYKNEAIMDTVSYDVLVSDELIVKDFYNYPNPMKNETNFIFNLAGAENPNSFKIKIYTVSGRLIKEIDYPVYIGYNEIPWDGKDNDGDFVANGTYFYKLITQ